MDYFNEIQPVFWASSILITGAAFTVFWFLDALQHKELVHEDLSSKELQTHRLILAASMLMEVSLITMYWFPLESLPFFLACFFTRTAHEFMDELHWHMDRCTPYESMLHLGMWLSILSNTFLMFGWGFFTQYKGVTNLNLLFYGIAIVLFIAILVIGSKEWNRKKST